MSYNCFIKSRSAFLLLYNGEMTLGFLCRSTSPSVRSRRRRQRNGISEESEMEQAKVV